MRRAITSTLLGLVACEVQSSTQADPSPTHASASDDPSPGYVGTRVCAECHVDETARWTGSDHDLAMQAPSSDHPGFDGHSVEVAGERQRFVAIAEQLLVEVTRRGERPLRYPVRYLFGAEPLQQVLLEAGDGRLQALTTAWDTRPAEQGGQRWYALRDDAAPGDALHWTGSGYTWNTQCADCHSTAVERGYELDGDRFDTRFAEIDVGCEACHGPGSAHVDWARAGEPAADHGLTRPLIKPAARRWTLLDGLAIARLSTAPDRRELEACGPCHSRRTDLGPGAGERFDDRYRLALLDEGLYFADGQADDEVFVLGSFLQSKMHAAGVVCSDCHEPHGLELRGETVIETCTSCHRAEVFAGPSHHFHQPRSEAASCESCHMPQRIYMGVDGRRDHRFGVPMPRLSAKVGAPDPCLRCHDTRDAEWAAAAIDAQFGERSPRWEFATALWMARNNHPEAGSALEQIIASQGPAIVRATALCELALVPTPRLVEVLDAATRDPSPLLRRAAATAAMSLPSSTRVQLITPLLRDEVRSVRIEAAAALLEVDTAEWSADARAGLDAAIVELRDAKLHAADRAEALVDLAALDLRGGQPDEARAKLERAIARDPAFSPAYLNLADLHRLAGREAEAEAVLRGALTRAAEPALIHHALGLSLIRSNRDAEALVELRRAHELAPEHPQFAYAYNLARRELVDPND